MAGSRVFGVGDVCAAKTSDRGAGFGAKRASAAPNSTKLNGSDRALRLNLGHFSGAAFIFRFSIFYAPGLNV